MPTQNRIALITGGSRGLGKNMAEHIAAKGLDVIITYHSKKAEALAIVAEIEKGGQKAAALQLDAGHIKSFDGFFSEIKSLLKDKFHTNHFDFLVNNAGTGVHASFADTTEDQFDELMNLHFKGVFFLTQKALPLMNDGGGIINISSGLARSTSPGYSAYASMKGGIETLTKYLAKELGARQIRANVIAPGAVETDFGGGLVRDNPEVNKMVASTVALGRVGLPNDIGPVVAFLCTPEAAWIDAQRIEVSGGRMI